MLKLKKDGILELENEEDDDEEDNIKAESDDEDDGKKGKKLGKKAVDEPNYKIKRTKVGDMLGASVMEEKFIWDIKVSTRSVDSITMCCVPTDILRSCIGRR